MTSEAQNTANRANAQASTGPRTAEGKARVARNSVTLGLFAARDLVLPEEQPEYDELRDALEAELLPATVMERTLAVEILHATWRLRRCALTEAGLNPDDPETMAATQATIDRARAHARNNLHRATADLSRLQTERHLRAQLAPDTEEILVSHQAIAKALAQDTRRRLNLRKLNDLDNFDAIINAATYTQQSRDHDEGALTSDPVDEENSSHPLQNKPNPAAADPGEESLRLDFDKLEDLGGLEAIFSALAREIATFSQESTPPSFSHPLQSKPNSAASTASAGDPHDQ